MFGDKAFDDECNFEIMMVNDPKNNKFLMLIRGQKDGVIEGQPLNKMILLHSDLFGQFFDVKQPEPVLYRDKVLYLPENSDFISKNMQNISI